jgi:1-acyl-sn-glycerol-3-phosphate acyltransferase
MRKVLRCVWRSLWLAATMMVAGGDFLLTAVRHGFRPTLATRTGLLQRNSRRVLPVFVERVETNGPLPDAGLLVCNHLSYVDILLLASLVPAVFVSKHEVRHWPVLGWFARMAGTIFVRRDRRSDVARINEEIQRVLRAGHLVVLFPEGTSSNGRQVLPFRSSLLEPATGLAQALFVGHIAYAIREGSLENDVCYWGEMTFFPHAVGMLSRPRIAAHVRFSRVADPERDRKDLARQLHAEVVRLGPPGWDE